MNKTNTPLLKAQKIVAHGMSSPIDLTVLPGQVWMLSGPSGTGKSLCLKSLANLIPHNGSVQLKQVEQSNMPPEIWRKQVMYFAAETAWWLNSIEEHFEKIPHKTQLEYIGLPYSILKRHPDSCSSGEKQRLALLRGLSYSPTVLLLDEITANLDYEATLQVEALLQAYLSGLNLLEIGGEKIHSTVPKERAIIWVSHDREQTQRMASKACLILFKHEKQGLL